MQQEEAAMKTAQPSGQKMDQARARFRRAVEAGEKAMLTLQKAQESFEQAQRHVEPRRRATAGAPGTSDPGVESVDSDLFGPCGPGGRCCIGWREGCGLLQLGCQRSGADGRLRGDACARWAVAGDGLYKREPGGAHAADPTSEEDACVGAVLGTATRRSVIAGSDRMSTRKSRGHGFIGTLAASRRSVSSLCKFLRLWTAWLSPVAWFSCSVHMERPRPACFDRAFGFLGEGPLSFQGVLEVAGMCITPTQEFRTCFMVRW